jgi:hypothetical protein
VESRLLFLIGAPRSGSTLLARMIGAHSAVLAPPEPHLLTPLAHLGYYENVEKAAYDPVITRGAMHELVGNLPRGEDDYLDAMRACTDHLYARLLESSGRQLLLDKTPAYTLVLDFVAKLYPKARYLVLTRNPLAVWSSYVQSFFDGDHEVAHAHNPLLERYVPAVARFLREQTVPILHLRYEELVRDPDAHLKRVCSFAGLDFEPRMVEYGSQEQNRAPVARGLGDPIGVDREKRPTTQSLDKWSAALSGDPEKLEQTRRILASLTDPDLEAWGYRRRELEQQLDAIEPGGRRRQAVGLSRYTLERKLLVLLRRNIHHNTFGRLVRRLRNACDVLLR